MIDLNALKYVEVPKPRKNFYASDFNKSNLDLYFSWTGEPKTNPPKWYDTLRWGAGNGVEEKMLEILKMNDIVEQDYDQKLHGGFKLETHGILISGYTDARMKESLGGYPIEIKSINNKNSQDIKEYERGYPRENYVGQLSIYMEKMGKKKGYLFACTVDGLHPFWMECVALGKGKYKCGNVVVDIYAEFERWRKLLKENVEPGVMPDVFQYRYKYPVADIDWHNVSVNKISGARNGHSVIGDWQLQFSDWKDKIVELQGDVLGYTNAELEIILEKTKGYTTWKKKPAAKKATKKASKKVAKS